MLFPALLLVATLLAGCTSDARPEPRAAGSPAATYSVFPPTTPFGEPPEAIVRNTGGVPLEYPHEFELDVLEEGGAWRTLPVTTDPEYWCDYERPSVLHPGDRISQVLTVCDLEGPPIALPAGTFRVRKTLLTIPSDQEGDPVEIRLRARFEVAEAGGDVPAPDRCRVLCMSDTLVEPGQYVRVTFDPPERYTWGVPSVLYEGTERTISPAAFLTAWLKRDEEITTTWPDRPAGYEDVGFRGRGSWRWKVPARLEPGVYSIVKQGIAGSVRIPIQDRRTYWTVSFEVVAPRR